MNTTITPPDNTPTPLSLEDILAAAKGAPVKPIPWTSEQLLPTIILLRDEKHMDWKEISLWVKTHADLYRSVTFWTTAYNKAKNIKKPARKPRAKAITSPTSSTPGAAASEPSTTPAATA